MQQQDFGFMRLDELIRVFNVSRTTVYALIKSGDIPAPRKVGRSSLWPREAVRDAYNRLAGLDIKHPQNMSMEMSMDTGYNKQTHDITR